MTFPSLFLLIFLQPICGSIELFFISWSKKKPFKDTSTTCAQPYIQEVTHCWQSFRPQALQSELALISIATLLKKCQSAWAKILNLSHMKSSHSSIHLETNALIYMHFTEKIMINSIFMNNEKLLLFFAEYNRCPQKKWCEKME